MKTRKRQATRLRAGLLAVAGVRAVLGVVAIPLAPVLYKEHFIALVLLRPSKEVLLAGGFFVRRGDVSLVALLAAAVPLAVWGVWHFFLLGHAYADEIRDGNALPAWAERIIRPKRIKQMCELLERKGPRVIIAGRVAAFPSTVLGAAAGVSDMDPKRFFIADGIGAALSITEVVLAGFLLGAAYKQAGPWVTAAGVVVMIGVLIYVGRSLRRT